MGNMRFKVGDRVRIKNLDWYNENINEIDEILCGITIFIPDMVQYGGNIVTISEVFPNLGIYRIKEDSGLCNWTDEMIEGLMEEGTLIERVDDNGLPFNEWLSHKGAFHIPDGYVLKDENGNVINAQKIVLEKKSPKTDDIIKWLRECDMTKYIGVLYSGMCSITFDTEGLITDFLKTVEDDE